MQCVLDQITLHIRSSWVLLVNTDTALTKLALSYSPKKGLDRSAAGQKLQDSTCVMSHYLHSVAKPLWGCALTSNSGLDPCFLMVMRCFTKCGAPFQPWIASLADTQSCYVLFSEVTDWS